MKWQRDLLGLLGALSGGVLGYFGFVWLVGQGFYAMVLPGGLVGMGAGLVKGGSIALAIASGIVALAVSLYAEWRVFPFAADESFSFFMQHLHEKAPMKLIMMAAGTAIGFWIPFRRQAPLTEGR